MESTLFANVSQVLQGIGSIATAVTVFFVWKQSKQTQKELDSTLRPWLEAEDFERDKEELVFNLKNRGSIPASVVSTRSIASAVEISITELMNQPVTIRKGGKMCFPQQYLSQRVDFCYNDKYIGYLLNFRSGKIEYEYGFIKMINPDEKGVTLTKDEWEF